MLAVILLALLTGIAGGFTSAYAMRIRAVERYARMNNLSVNQMPLGARSSRGRCLKSYDDGHRCSQRRELRCSAGQTVALCAPRVAEKYASPLVWRLDTPDVAHLR